jgi:hypothetical protein
MLRRALWPALLLTTACVSERSDATIPASTGTEARAQEPLALHASDVAAILESGIGRAVPLSAEDFRGQTEIEMEVTGCEGGLPAILFGLSVVPRRDGNHPSDERITPCTVRFSVFQRDRARYHVTIVKSRLGGEEFELWISHRDGKWCIDQEIGRAIYL